MLLMPPPLLDGLMGGVPKMGRGLSGMHGGGGGGGLPDLAAMSVSDMSLPWGPKLVRMGLGPGLRRVRVPPLGADPTMGGMRLGGGLRMPGGARDLGGMDGHASRLCGGGPPLALPRVVPAESHPSHMAGLVLPAPLMPGPRGGRRAWGPVTFDEARGARGGILKDLRRGLDDSCLVAGEG